MVLIRTPTRLVSPSHLISGFGVVNSAGGPVEIRGTGNLVSPLSFLQSSGIRRGSGGGSLLSPSSIIAAGGSVNTGGKFSFFTSFPTVEKPLSQGGIWVTGKAQGRDWNDPESIVGESFASINSGLGTSAYDDSIAHLSTAFHTFAPDQYAEGVVFLAPGYTGNSSNHEIELHLRWKTLTGNATGIEIGWGIQGYLFVVRWLGGLGQYVAIFDPGIGSIPPPVNGDRLRAEVRGSHLIVLHNGVIVPGFEAIDVSSCPPIGQPGHGYWPNGNAVRQNYGWHSYQAGEL